MSSQTATVQSRVTPEIKIEAEALLKSIGLNSSSFVRLVLTNLVRTREIPHELLEIPNAETIAAIREVEKGKTTRLPAGGFRELAKRAR
ncbi:MAG TPA: type II toxin-antitoxin system RelB/DinJ family antitoxin [Rhodanobacter sp.]|nr:type II toxin-antitoxin system RelB/DinJ family antitoxin [Rhodanobacter sp.]